nr:protein UPSTREAM OF FLC [Ipomoea batatas]
MTEVGGRGCGGESRPDAAKTQDNIISNKNRVFSSSRPTFKKVQVVYYLSRNGHLEHPHYMEVTHLVHRHLLLKDVMDRLTALRGKGMPSLYSWSCKRCSRGACTEEKDKNGGELTRDDSSSPSTTSSLSEKGNDGNNASRRFEDGDPVVAESSLLSRNSVLFQLISCGGSASFRGKTLAPFTKQAAAAASVTVGRKSCSGSSLQKEVLIRVAAAARATPPKGTEDEEEIKYMSENPRFGNMQSEEKEYFSGSIVESITTEERAGINPGSLKKSNSYNEERSCNAGLGDGAEKEGKRRGKSEKGSGKCIPIKKSSSKHSKK